MDNKEDYRVSATLTVGDKIIENVLCEIYTPNEPSKKPLIEFYPTLEQFSALEKISACQFLATIGNGEKIQTSITSRETHLFNKYKKFWGNKLATYCRITGEPQHLTIKNYRRGFTNLEKTLFQFFLSPNSLLEPEVKEIPSYDGSISCEQHNIIKMFTEDETPFLFMNFYTYPKRTHPTGSLTRKKHLILYGEKRISPDSVDEIQEQLFIPLENSLFLYSFATRTRTSILKWVADNGLVESKYYRGEFLFPTGYCTSASNTPLISKNDIENFLKIASQKIKEIQDNDFIYNAISTLVPFREKTVDTEFMSSFSSLEALILHHRRSYNLEFILDKEIFKKLKKYITSSIKSYDDILIQKQKRCFLYKNINQLNRVTISDAYNNMIKHYGIYTGDMWPVFKTNGSIGLADIRNMLFHGNVLPRDSVKTVSIMNKYLHVLLERILLKILGWEYNNSDAKTRHPSIKDDPNFLAAQKELKTWVETCSGYNKTT